MVTVVMLIQNGVDIRQDTKKNIFLFFQEQIIVC